MKDKQYKEMAALLEDTREHLAEIVKEDINALRVWDTLINSWKIYLQREEQYGPGWRRFGWRASVLFIMQKADRIRAQLWRPEPDESMDLDSLRDLINYALFAIVNIEDGNEYGA